MMVYGAMVLRHAMLESVSMVLHQIVTMDLPALSTAVMRMLICARVNPSVAVMFALNLLGIVYAPAPTKESR
jgi:hypothetical protein